MGHLSGQIFLFDTFCKQNGVLQLLKQLGVYILQAKWGLWIHICKQMWAILCEIIAFVGWKSLIFTLFCILSGYLHAFCNKKSHLTATSWPSGALLAANCIQIALISCTITSTITLIIAIISVEECKSCRKGLILRPFLHNLPTSPSIIAHSIANYVQITHSEAFCGADYPQ